MDIGEMLGGKSLIEEYSMEGMVMIDVMLQC